MATVDVIVPAFNAAKFLPAALRSVSSQTFDDWRVVLVDDGSTDDTVEVLAPFVEAFGPKLLYIKQANAGLPAARNTAIRASDGKYLALLDADDAWLPDRLTDSVRALTEHPSAGLAYGLVTFMDGEGKPGETFRGNPRYAQGRIAPYIYMRKVELPCPTITFRRECVDEVGLFDQSMRATEDRDLWLRIALRHEVAYIPKVIALYRVSAGSMSTDPNRMLKAQLQFLSKHFGQPGCGYLARQIGTARAYKQRAEAFKRQSRPLPALKSSLRALALYPFDPDNSRTSASLLIGWLKSLQRRE